MRWPWICSSLLHGAALAGLAFAGLGGAFRDRREIPVVISTNVRPEYQSWGLGLLLMLDLYDRMIDSWLDEVEFSWVLESNDLSRKTIERAGLKRVATFRIYDLEGPPPGAAAADRK